MQWILTKRLKESLHCLANTVITWLDAVVAKKSPVVKPYMAKKRYVIGANAENIILIVQLPKTLSSPKNNN
jgi:hypothetical protein